MKTLEELYSESKKRLPGFLDIYASQEGEDVLLRRLLKSRYQEPGIYVDVGAHHPLRFSNTAHYYMRGWWGINIEPHPQNIQLFNELRPRDTNLNIAIGTGAASDYFVFEEPAFNTFDFSHTEFALTKTKLIGKHKVEKTPLSLVLNKYLPKENVSDLVFFTIDVEGIELEVLRTNDWSVYRPLLVLVEALDDAKQKTISDYLADQAYFFVARTKNTYFLAEEKFKKDFVD